MADDIPLTGSLRHTMGMVRRILSMGLNMAWLKENVPSYAKLGHHTTDPSGFHNRLRIVLTIRAILTNLMSPKDLTTLAISKTLAA